MSRRLSSAKIRFGFLIPPSNDLTTTIFTLDVAFVFPGNDSLPQTTWTLELYLYQVTAATWLLIYIALTVKGCIVTGFLCMSCMLAFVLNFYSITGYSPVDISVWFFLPDVSEIVTWNQWNVYLNIY